MSKLYREYVVIVGGPRTGKTLNREALMEHYKCSECFDCPGEELDILESRADRILILTWDENLTDPRFGWTGSDRFRPRLEGTRVPVEDAAAALGNRWIEPKR